MIVLLSVIDCIPEVVSSAQVLPICAGILNLLVFEYLRVVVHPETDDAIQDGCKHHNSDCQAVQSVIEHGRLPIVLGQKELVDDEYHTKGKEGDGEEDRHASTEHEGRKDYVEDERIFVVD